MLHRLALSGAFIRAWAHYARAFIGFTGASDDRPERRLSASLLNVADPLFDHMPTDAK